MPVIVSRSTPLHPAAVRPEAIAVMGAIGIDISAQHPKSVDDFDGWRLDYVITVCDHAKEFCPLFPGSTTHLHWSFTDPAVIEGSDVDRKAAFRKVRDEIRNRVRAFVAEHVVFAHSKGE